MNYFLKYLESEPNEERLKAKAEKLNYECELESLESARQKLKDLQKGYLSCGNVFAEIEKARKRIQELESSIAERESRKALEAKKNKNWFEP